MKVSRAKLDELAENLETMLEDIRTNNETEYDVPQRSTVFLELKKVQAILEPFSS